MSQKEADEAASAWLGQFALGRDLTGKEINLSDKGDTLPPNPIFRRMVLQSAQKKLKKRGAREIILPQ